VNDVPDHPQAGAPVVSASDAGAGPPHRVTAQEAPAGTHKPDARPARLTGARTGPVPHPGRRPGYVVVVGLTPQMREQHPAAPLSLDEALRAGHRERDLDRLPLIEMEAEP
jgi:hypothetical protein